ALIVMSCAALLGTGATIGVVDYFAGDLPSIDAIQTANLSQTTRILDRNGKLIEAPYPEHRTVVSLSQINPQPQAAKLATKDRTEAAAGTYFQVHASDLTWAQASFLAGLPQAPSDYNPFGTPDQVDAAKGRWRQVLDSLVAVGQLAGPTADSIFAENVIPKMI